MIRKGTGKFFPKDFKDFKIIKKFSKPRSPKGRAFVTDDPKEWFVDVIHYKKSTGEVTGREQMIIASDIPSWTLWYKNLGWEEEKV